MSGREPGSRLNRRGVLKGLAALGAASCIRRAGESTLSGSIVGGAHGRGHRIRDGFRPHAAQWQDAGVVIVGAGVAGLSAAWALERAGFRDFVVLELEDEPGGTSRSGRGAITPFPWGAHYVPVPSPANRPLVALMEEVGAVTGRDASGRPRFAEEVLCRDPQERLYFRGEWYEGLYPRVGARPEDISQLEAFEADMKRWAAWRDRAGRRGFAVPRARGSDDEAVRTLDRVSMADYMEKHGWTSSRLRWFVEYACRDDFGASLAQTSAWAGIHYFASRLEGPDAPPPAPAPRARSDREQVGTPGFISGVPEVLTWPEGNGRLVRHLASVVGTRLRVGALVTEIQPGTAGVEVTYLDVATGAVRGIRSAHAVFALPRFLAGPLVRPWSNAPPPHLGATVYGSWMVANLTLRDRPASRGFPLAWDNVLYDSPSLGYVVATHQSGRDHGPTVFTYYLPLLDEDVRRARNRLLATSWQDWVARILADLEPAHPGLRDLVETIDVYLWGHAMVRPRPGFLWSEALAESARPLGRLHFAHTDLSGMALFEEAQYWGVRAAESILRDRRHAFRSWLYETRGHGV